MRKSAFVLIQILSLILINQVPAQINHKDPLFRNYIIGNSAEIAMTWPGPTESDSCQLLTYNFTGSISPEGSNTYHGLPNQIYLKMNDIAAGDFNGDGKDDLVMAQTFQNNEVKLIIPVLEGFYLMGPSHWEAVIGNLYLGHVTAHHLDYTNIRIISGNFDDDAAQEFALAFWNDTNKKISIRIYNANQLNAPQLAASIDTDYLDPNLEDAARFDITAGDFNGDGIDEIFLAAGYIVEGSTFGVFARVLKCALQNSQIIECVRHNEIYKYNTGSTTNNEGQWVERIVVATADFNNDKRDEAVLAFQERDAKWEDTNGVWPGGWDYSTWTNFVLRPLKVEADLQSIYSNAELQVHHYTGWVTHIRDQGWAYYALIGGNAMSLATGDLNLDGRDEILWQFNGCLRGYTVNNSLQVTEVITYNGVGRYSDPSIKTLAVADLNVNPNEELWLPEIIMFDWEGPGGGPSLQILRASLNSTKQIVGYTKLTQLGGQSTYNYNPIALAVGDFDGDGVRFGKPNYHQAKNVSQPVVILNAPPIHFDVLSDTFDINMCFNEHIGSERFISRYINVISQSDEILTEVTSDWGLSASIGVGASYMEANARIYMEGNYGRGFSAIHAQAYQITVGSTQTAKHFDQILASTIDYEIWEYPVLWNAENQGHIAVIVPAEPRWSWYANDTWSSLTYINPHEPANLLSYKDYNDIIEENADIDSLISMGSEANINHSSYLTSDPNWWIDMSTFQSGQISNSHKIGMEMGHELTGNGLNLSLIGHYSRSQISTHKTIFSEDVKLDVFFDNITSAVEAPYQIIPYAYWSYNGALVLDYNVRLLTWEDTGTKTFWDDYTNAPDIAMVLPWRHFPEMGIQLYDNSKKSKTTDIFIKPDSLAPGKNITLYANIHNFSLVNCENDIDIHFYHGNPESNGTPIGTSTILGGILARDAEQVFIDWNIPETVPDSSRIYVVIDPENLISEIHEDNNKGWMLLQVPGGLPVEIEQSDFEKDCPERYQLYSNYPNPFNPTTTIGFDLPKQSQIELTIFNLLGQRIKILAEGYWPAGYHSVQWDGTDLSGWPVSSGMYLYRLSTDDDVQTRKMVVIK